MSSAIEHYLYGSRGTHALVAFSLAEGRVVVAVAPWEELSAVTEAVFESAELLSIWVAPDNTPADIALPWDIIGFDSYEVSDGRWKFVVYCSVVEFVWQSAWPRLTSGPRPESAR